MIPAVEQYYYFALKIYRLQNPLIVATSKCNHIDVPSEDQTTGVDADVVVYIWGFITSGYAARGSYCQSDAGAYKRTLVGAIEINTNIYFGLDLSGQIAIMLHECAHILVFSSTLFTSFVNANGEAYNASSYVVDIEYPNRGKTVKALGFPNVVKRASETFGCSLQGVELEDAKGSGTAGNHWELRIMPHDLMAGILTFEVVISDITLAMFEDSGWYVPDYQYSQPLYWGKNLGCRWLEEKCIENNQAQFPGICTNISDASQCDAYNLGYGYCFYDYYPNIPAHEQYFANASLGGGFELLDYCPVIYTYSNRRCRNATGPSTVYYGETKGMNSRCFMNTLQSKDYKYDIHTNKGTCYNVVECNENKTAINVGTQTIDCPFGASVTVDGYNGKVECPGSYDFCRPVPCLNMCMGQGKCVNGTCVCHSQYSGFDCSIKCSHGCNACSRVDACIRCDDKYVLYNKTCIDPYYNFTISSPEIFFLNCTSEDLVIKGSPESSNISWSSVTTPSNYYMDRFISNSKSSLLIINYTLLSIGVINLTFSATNALGLPLSVNKSISIVQTDYTNISTGTNSSFDIYPNQTYEFRVSITNSKFKRTNLTYMWKNLSSLPMNFTKIISNSKINSCLAINPGDLREGYMYTIGINVTDLEVYDTGTLNLNIKRLPDFAEDKSCYVTVIPSLIGIGIVVLCGIGVAMFRSCDKGDNITQEYKIIVYHPLLSFFIRQIERRWVGCLQVSAVFMSNLFVTGVLCCIFELSSMVDGNYTRNQIIQGFIGIIIVEVISLALTILNQVNENRKFSRLFCGFCSVLLILSEFPGVIYLNTSYCAQYWVKNFLIFLSLEIIIFENLFWLINFLIFKKPHDIIRVEYSLTDKEKVQNFKL